MDYEVGSVAALISGDVTPNRPKLVRRALTPMKHQQSPNVTPKSEFVDDRSIFLSPSLQKKKAIVKKSPKRIFQNPDLDVTSENLNSSLTSPKADKVRKHLKEDLDNDNSQAVSPKSPKNKHNKSTESTNISKDIDEQETVTMKKNKKKRNSSLSNISNIATYDQVDTEVVNSPKKMGNLFESTEDTSQNDSEISGKTPKKNKNKKRKSTEITDVNEAVLDDDDEQILNKNIDNSEIPKKKKKKSKKAEYKIENNSKHSEEENLILKSKEIVKNKSKNKNIVNPNAITDKDTDSEHESDNEIESETEQANNEILNTGPAQESSDEEEQAEGGPEKVATPKVERAPETGDEIKRTLFVGNVPFSNKCKKEIKKIFNKYGAIETIRIRTVPVKDARVTPKMAVIKNELHPERSTVNVYIKYKEPSSVEEALVENNTVLNDNHLRVSRSDSTGAEHDPRLSVFVGNLPFALEDEGLRERFQKCGEIVSVRIIRDKKTNAGKGFGYVNFASKDGVELALALTDEDLTMKNRILRVKRCTQGGHKQNNQNKYFKGKQFNQGRGQNQGRNFSGPNRGRNFSGPNQGRNFSGQNQGKNFNGNKQFGKKPAFGQRQTQYGDNIDDGAQRRIMNKRKIQENGEGPSNKMPNTNKTVREKKARKEFVGMTSEKKKKHTFNKGQKKKKVLSEILANK
ncbi:uncharacterized protein ACR2FA_008737 [Aphomia sociella]